MSPIYEYKCPHCGEEEQKLVSYQKREEQLCKFCGFETEYKPQFRFNATGLPNGFAPTKGASRIKKNIGKADDK